MFIKRAPLSASPRNLQKVQASQMFPRISIKLFHLCGKP
jgi:hypothetical protein